MMETWLSNIDSNIQTSQASKPVNRPSKSVSSSAPQALLTANESDQVILNNKVLNSQNVQKKSRGGFKEGISSVWKFFATLNQMTISTIKGLYYGALTAGATLAGAWLFGPFPKVFKKGGPKFMAIVKQPLKHIGTFGKALAIVGAASTVAYHLIVGKMAANERTAVIDHKLHTGHREV